MAKEPLAGCSRPNRARGTIDQLSPHCLLKPAELLTDSGLRHVQPVGRCGKAANVDDGNEGAE